MNSLPTFLQIFIRPQNTYICHNDHDPRHEVCSDLVDNPETGLLMTRHISTNVSSGFAQRFFTLAKALQ